MTLTLELTDEMQRRLEEMAQQQQKTPEVVALEALRASLENDAPQKWSSAAVRDTAHSVIAEDIELLRRLAQ